MQTIIESNQELPGMPSPENNLGQTEKPTGQTDQEFSLLIEAIIGQDAKEDNQDDQKDCVDNPDLQDRAPMLAAADLIQQEDVTRIRIPGEPDLKIDSGKQPELVFHDPGLQDNGGGRDLPKQIPERRLFQQGPFKSGTASSDMQFVKQDQGSAGGTAATDANREVKNHGSAKHQIDFSPKMPAADSISGQQSASISGLGRIVSEGNNVTASQQQPSLTRKGKTEPVSHESGPEVQVAAKEQDTTGLKYQPKISVANPVLAGGKREENDLVEKGFKLKTGTIVHDRPAPGGAEFTRPHQLNEGVPAESSSGVQVPKGLEGEIVKQVLARIKLNRARIPSRASIRLEPEHLGRLRVELRAEGHQVSIKMTAENHAVKQVLEASLSHLRNELQQQGMDLKNVEVFVGRDTNQQREADTRRRPKENRRIRLDQVEDGDQIELSRKSIQQTRQSGELDTFV